MSSKRIQTLFGFLSANTLSKHVSASQSLRNLRFSSGFTSGKSGVFASDELNNNNEHENTIIPEIDPEAEFDVSTLEPFKTSPYREKHSGLNIDASLDPDSIIHSQNDLKQFKYVNPLPKELRQEYNDTMLHGYGNAVDKRALLNKLSQYSNNGSNNNNSSDKEMINVITMRESKYSGEVETSSKTFEKKLKSNEKQSYGERRRDRMELLQLTGNDIDASRLSKRAKILAKNPNFKVVNDVLDRPVTFYKRQFVQGSQCDGCGVELQNEDPNKPGFVHLPSNDQNRPNNNENDTIMDNVYISDKQKLFLMDMGKMDKTETNLKYSAYNDIIKGNKEASNEEKMNKSQRLKTIVYDSPVCQRCHQMIYYRKSNENENSIELNSTIKKNKNRISPIKYFPNTLSDHSNSLLNYKEMIPKQFESLMQHRFLNAKQRVCIIKIIDIFDFHGSFIFNLEEILRNTKEMIDNKFYGQNIEIPLIIGLNKIDLLTKHIRFNEQYIVEWAYSECKRFLDKQNNNNNNSDSDSDSDNKFSIMPKAIVPICCKTGYNIDKLLEMACDAAPINKIKIKKKDKDGNRKMINASAKTRYRDIYVIGSANAGKSTLLNKLHGKNLIHSVRQRPLTTSPIAGTTLGILPFIVPNYQNTRLLDTPGVISQDSLALRLTTDELQMLQPKKQVKPRTYKLGEGQSLILGTMGRIDFIEGKPFYFTVFASPSVTTHICKTENVDSVMVKHSCSLLQPVCDKSRLLYDERLQMTKYKTFSLEGIGWQASVVDIVFPGLGWVAVTGCQRMKIDAYYLPGIKVGLRRPLLPRDMYANVVNKKKPKNQKKR